MNHCPCGKQIKRESAEYERRGLDLIRITETEVRAGDFSALERIAA